MKNYAKRLKSALVKLFKRERKLIGIGEWLTLIGTLVIVTAIGFFVFDYNAKTKKLSEIKQAEETNTISIEDYTLSTTIDDSDKKEAKKALEEALKHSQNLGRIEIINSFINVKHAVTPDEKANPNSKAIVEKKAPAEYRGFVNHQEIEWEPRSDLKGLIAYIDRPTINKEDVKRDNRVEPTILKHPAILLTEAYKDKNELIQGWKKYVDNDYKDFGMTDEKIALLDAKWDRTFEDAAYEKIEKDLLSDPQFVKKFEKMALESVSNIYNTKGRLSVINYEGEEIKSDVVLGLPVEVRFKDQRV